MITNYETKVQRSAEACPKCGAKLVQQNGPVQTFECGRMQKGSHELKACGGKQ